MKTIHFSTFILALTLACSIGCSNKKPDVSQEPATGVPVVNTDTAVADNTNVVQHFMCPNHCKGSGGATEGTCPVCGTAYVHNDAFHKGQSTPEPAMKIDPVTHQAVPTHTEATNARGIYHFLCPNGDPGGAGVAGNCSKCGAALVHNQAFHNN